MRRRAIAAFFACFAIVGGARAAEVTAPRRDDFTLVPYPAGAQGEAKVVLVLDVDVNGEVVDVEAIAGLEPFSSAAIAAARGWRFEPATVDGVAIRAKVRVEVEFKPGPALAPPKVVDTARPTPAVELLVEAKRPEIGQTTIDAKEVRTLPGAFGDPFRMIEALPGVTPIISGLPFFYVRGAPPGDTGYFVDDIPLPLLFHVGAGPSVLAAGLIDHVDFFAGGYPARYGRYTGGIVAGETGGPSDHTRVEYGVRTFDANALVETHFDGDKGDVLVSGRYGYPGLLLSLLSSKVGLQYWDYQLRAGYKADDRDRISVFAFGAFDQLTDKTKNQIVFGTQFHRVDLRLDRRLDDGALRLAATIGFDRTQIGDGSFATVSPSFRVRAEIDRGLTDAVRLRAGVDFGEQTFAIGIGDKTSGDSQTEADIAKLFPSRIDRTMGARADLLVRPTSGVEIVPGVRFDVFNSGRTTVPALDPRLSTRVEITRKLAWISSFAVAHQPPAFIVPVPGLQFGSLAGGLQEAYQAAEGAEVALPFLDSTLRASAFYNSLLRVDDVLASCPSSNRDDSSPNRCSLDERANGRTVGMELFLKRDFTKRLAGWISYTLSRSERFFRGVTILSQFDRTHVLAVVGSYDLGRGWRLGLRWSFTSGTPYDDPNAQDDGSGRPPKPIGRLPSFNRLDFRLEKRWTTSNHHWISFVAEWFNATLQKEATEFVCDSNNGHCGPSFIGPVTIPSLGVEGAL